MAATASRWRDPWAWGLALWGFSLATLAFPPGVLWPLVLAGPAPLWVGALGCPPPLGFRRGFFFGVGFFGGLLWWLVPTVHRYGFLPWPVAGACLVLLTLYLALYPAAAGSSVAALSGRSPGLALALAPLLWTGFEWVRGWLLSGFPWGDLPQALWRVPAVLRLAPWVGIDGVRLLVAAGSGALAWLAVGLLGRRRAAWVGLLPAAALGPVAALLLAWPTADKPPSSQLRVGVVQGNVDQAQKWDPTFREQTIGLYLDLTRGLAEHGLDLVVWPETAMPFLFQDPLPERSRLEDFARGARIPLLFGAPAYQAGPRGTEFRNAVFLVDREGRQAGRYDKVHLVPFGEYVPLGRLFPFVSKLVQGVGDFTAGPGAVPVRLGSDGPSLGPLVCFEVTFSGLASEHAARGAQLLAVVTNDGWFGRTPGPYQHLAFAAWRAAETGLPLVRAANTGISAVFDDRGRLLRATELQARDSFAVTLDLPPPHRTPQLTLRPWIGPLCLALALPFVFAIVRPLSTRGRWRGR